MPSTVAKASLAAIAALLPAAQAGWDPSSTNNLAVYWGQNSAGQADSQERLGWYCERDNSINVIDISFLTGLKNLNLNLASATDKCTPASTPGLYTCPEVEEDIKTCQDGGKTIIMSLGGAGYAEGGFSSDAEAESVADTVWKMFGPDQGDDSITRPFGSAVVDGFDFDFESAMQHMEPFAARLRSYINQEMDGGSKPYYLSAAPQCPYPDAADSGFIDGQVDFDWVQVQYYNNWCGAKNFANKNAWNFDEWDTWAKSVAKNPNAKVLLGLPASTSAAGASDYVSGSLLNNAVSDAKSYSSYAGVMLWDMSQLYANSGYEDAILSAMGAPASGGNDGGDNGGGDNNPGDDGGNTGPTTTLTTVTRTSTSTSTPTGALIPKFGQCGGEGYSGSGQCQPPWTCQGTQWWKSCK